MGYSFKEPVRKQNKMAKFLNSKKVVPYVFVSPFLISFLILTFYPTIQAFIMSFQKILPGEVSFIGLSNYERIVNSTFYQALTNLTVVILVTIPIILAVVLDSKVVKFKTIFRSALFIPTLTSTVVAGIIFRLVFAESDLAVANQIIGWFGLGPIDWQYNGWSGMLI